tara:strand:+ start:222 stop:506 length:285 start_codon:yes stop_codon:yes gene_type:complete
MVAAAGSVVEKSKDVPVATDGAGIAGQSAALASARLGMNTLLIDRFGSLGGNIGPTMIAAGSIYGETDVTLPGGLPVFQKNCREAGNPARHAGP